MKIIDGRKIAQKIKQYIREEVKRLDTSPSLHVISVGKDKISEIFLSEKEKACLEVGISFYCHRFSARAKAEEIIKLINRLNSDPGVTGILIQLPLPPQLGEGATLLDQISSKKDVDCLTSLNFGRFALGIPLFLPPLVQAVEEILQGEKIKGKKITVVGAGRIAGLPISIFFLQKGATVTICQEFTQNLKEQTRKADILVSATGQPKLINGSMVKKGAIVIDVGTSWRGEKIVGDVDRKSVEKKAKLITPVPGGIGPLTVAFLLKNTVRAATIAKRKKKGYN